MHNAIRVAVRRSHEYLLNDNSGVLLSEAASPLHLVKQFTALAQLSDHIIPFLLLKKFKHPQHIRMVLQSRACVHL